LANSGQSNTWVQIKDAEGELERHTLTYSHWENTADGRTGWHPATFGASETLIQNIEAIQVCYFSP